MSWIPTTDPNRGGGFNNWWNPERIPAPDILPEPTPAPEKSPDDPDIGINTIGTSYKGGEYLPIKTTLSLADKNYFPEGEDQMMKNWAVADAATAAGDPTVNLAKMVRKGMSSASPALQYQKMGDEIARDAQMANAWLDTGLQTQAAADQNRMQVEAAKAQEFNQLASWLRDRIQVANAHGLGVQDILAQSEIDQLNNQLALMMSQGQLLGQLFNMLMGMGNFGGLGGLGTLGDLMEQF